MSKTRLGGGLATRYGTAPRRRYIDVLTRMRRFHECPRCRVRAAKRVSVGLWQCRKCGYQFTGGAYIPSTKTGETAKRSAGVITYSPTIAETSAAPTIPGTPSPESRNSKRKPRRKKPSEETSKEGTK